MKFFSSSEYEFGVIAMGAAPIGLISIGMAPVGVIAIGVLPVGLLAVACGAGLGAVNFTCGVGLGAYVRACGVAFGGDAAGVGLELSLAGDPPPEGEAERPYAELGAAPGLWSRVLTRFGSSYGIRLALVAAVIMTLLGFITRERLALTHMTRTMTVTWAAHPAKSEGIYLEPDADCRVTALLRSDGFERVHANLQVVCGSLVLAKRQVREGCTVEQVANEGGHSYRLRCSADYIPAHHDEDSSSPEVPSLELDTIQARSARIYAQGPPPMNVQLQVDSLSQPVSGPPLLTEGRTQLTDELGVGFFLSFSN